MPVSLPPILCGQDTPEVRARVEQFYFSVAAIFETWVKRRQSKHTQRAYREDIMVFVNFAKRLPGAMKEVTGKDGTPEMPWI